MSGVHVYMLMSAVVCVRIIFYSTGICDNVEFLIPSDLSFYLRVPVKNCKLHNIVFEKLLYTCI